jgi:tetratricopeptide (TPR) repeat protein
LTDIFAVESEIASKIADTLQAKLTIAEQRAIASHPMENSEAYQLYLRGRFYWNKGFAPGFEKSREYYQQAIELDPTYALAYAGLADYYGFAFANGLFPPEEKWAKAEEDTAKKALELDPTLGEAYNPLAAAKLYYHRDWPGAERDFRYGLELSPNFAEMHLHYAFCLVLFGRNEEALGEMHRALDLDPLSPTLVSVARDSFSLCASATPRSINIARHWSSIRISPSPMNGSAMRTKKSKCRRKPSPNGVKR